MPDRAVSRSIKWIRNDSAAARSIRICCVALVVPPTVLAQFPVRTLAISFASKTTVNDLKFIGARMRTYFCHVLRCIDAHRSASSKTLCVLLVVSCRDTYMLVGCCGVYT